MGRPKEKEIDFGTLMKLSLEWRRRHPDAILKMREEILNKKKCLMSYEAVCMWKEKDPNYCEKCDCFG